MLPIFKRFSVQDVPNSPEWIEQVFTPLNTFCETTVATLNKGLTFGENVQGQIFSTSFTTSATYTAGDFTVITFNYSGGGQPKNCVVGQIKKTDGLKILTPVMISDWYLNLNKNPFVVTINYIAGLENSKTYNITFSVY